jgi:hypothetical protein
MHFAVTMRNRATLYKKNIVNVIRVLYIMQHTISNKSTQFLKMKNIANVIRVLYIMQHTISIKSPNSLKGNSKEEDCRCNTK